VAGLLLSRVRAILNSPRLAFSMPRLHEAAIKQLMQQICCGNIFRQKIQGDFDIVKLEVWALCQKLKGFASRRNNRDDQGIRRIAYRVTDANVHELAFADNVFILVLLSGRRVRNAILSKKPTARARLIGPSRADKLDIASTFHHLALLHPASAATGAGSAFHA
jgi:hypothetical protein